jgi:hypothetical protein
MTGHHLEIRPLSRHHWVVRYEGEVVPLSEHPTRTEAQAEARNYARQFGEPVIHVHGLNGKCVTEHIEPDYEAPTPRDVKGPKVEP